VITLGAPCCLSCPGKEPFCGCNIAAFTQEKIHRAALAIHRTVKVDPLATHLEVRFVHAPGIAHRQGLPLPAFLKIWDVLLHPTKNGGVGQGNCPVRPSSGPGHGSLSLKVRYHRTQSTIISWSKCCPLKRSFADAGSIIPGVTAGYRPFQAFAPEPYDQRSWLFRSSAGVTVTPHGDNNCLYML